MRLRLVSLFVALMMTASVAWSQGSDTYRYLVNATNEMSKIVGQATVPDKAALLHVTAQACDALSMLLEDPQFYEDLSRLHEEAGDSTGARKELKHELYLFVSSFLRIEDQALRDAGVDENVAREILWVASMFREEMDSEVTL